MDTSLRTTTASGTEIHRLHLIPPTSPAKSNTLRIALVRGVTSRTDGLLSLPSSFASALQIQVASRSLLLALASLNFGIHASPQVTDPHALQPHAVDRVTRVSHLVLHLVNRLHRKWIISIRTSRLQPVRDTIMHSLYPLLRSSSRRQKRFVRRFTGARGARRASSVRVLTLVRPPSLVVLIRSFLLPIEISTQSIQVAVQGLRHTPVHL